MEQVKQWLEAFMALEMDWVDAFSGNNCTDEVFGCQI